ncbi:MAG: Trigger factor [Parcubacteria group bacterium GW2011_GWA2_47_26]|nr:MAG: Trigger factor [Parcubacteria group bacterium GW2011_GWA2_47_26]
MNFTTKQLPKSTIEITVELSPEEMQGDLQKAALRLSQETTVPGFRPGKAPYDEVMSRFGAARIWEEAAQSAVPRIFTQIVKQDGLETIGSPAIDVVKLAPDNPFVFKATVAVLPRITLGDYATIKLEQKPMEIKDTQVDKVIGDLRKMQTKEAAVAREIGRTDKALVDMSMSLDSVPLEGGATKDHAIYMDEEYYIPGLKEQLIGLKKGDAKEFQLQFPKEHYQKMIAGKDVDFKITVKDVFELQRPPLDDEFAKKLGPVDIAGLRVLIQKNLQAEAEQKEAERQEIELLEKVLERTKFSDIPELLVNEETIKMLHEFEENVARQGMDFTEYLKKIGKTRDELRLDFAPEAVKRVKVALAARQIAQEKNITIDDSDVAAEVTRMLELYKDQPGMQEQIKSEAAREYLRGVLRNRKVIKWLRDNLEPSAK